ncbi:MAG: hypothetical protein LBG72_06935 [Spirochaetaceae bacterium]|jgi:KaiC/GvpD/RAD55 family RecA-like ATPase|nr:hypothetical protein [Spirochaetaceae bacterium]
MVVVKNELVQRSPVRVLEKAMQGGLGAGEMGVISGPSGLGKTSVLVQIALDKLLQDKKVIHISFTQNADFVIDWYSGIFAELVGKRSIENINAIKEQISRNRILMNFSQTGVDSDVIRKSLHSMIDEGGYKAEALIIDGFDFSLASYERIKTFKDFAAEHELTVWYSCTVTGEPPYNDKRVPTVLKDVESVFDCIVDISAKQNHLELTIVKERGAYHPPAPPVELDPRTLLLLNN